MPFKSRSRPATALAVAVIQTMSTTDMSAPHYTQAITTSEEDYDYILAATIQFTFVKYFMLALTVTIFIFGVASWIMDLV